MGVKDMRQVKSELGRGMQVAVHVAKRLNSTAPSLNYYKCFLKKVAIFHASMAFQGISASV